MSPKFRPDTDTNNLALWTMDSIIT